MAWGQHGESSARSTTFMRQRVGRIMLIVGAMLAGPVLSTASAVESPAMRRVGDPFSAQVLAPFAADFATPKDIGLHAEEVRIRNAFGNNLRAWYFPVDGAEQSIMICMGNTGNIACMLQYAEIFISGGFNVLMFDYQGFGSSEGSASVLSLMGDAAAAFDFLVKEKQQSPDCIGVFGVSLGSILAMAVAANKGAGAVATEDIFLPSRHADALEKHFRDEPLIQFAIRGLRATIVPQVDPLQTIRRLNCPLFLVHGEHDWLLPPSGSMELASVSEVPTRVWIMENVGHAPESLEANDLEFRSQLCVFFRDAFADEVREMRSANVVEPIEGQYELTISVDAHSIRKPVQICASNGRSAFTFYRVVPETTEPLKFSVPFPPSHVSSLVMQNTRTAGDGSWTPRLSQMSHDRDHFMQLTRNFEQQARVLIRDPRRKNRITGWYYDAELCDDLLTRIPSPKDVHPRVRPRYARWLAMLEVYSRSHHGVHSLNAAALSVEFLPADPENYYQLDNAAFELGLTDPFLARTLVWLARRKLEEGQFAECKRLLQMYLRIKPSSIDPVISPGHIHAIDETSTPDLLPEIPVRVLAFESSSD